MPHENHKQNRETLKSYFEPGERPTSHDFSDLIDSTINIKEDGIFVDKCDLIIDRNVIIKGKDHEGQPSLSVSGDTVIEGKVTVVSDHNHNDIVIDHGNITAMAFIGDGSQLEGIDAGKWEESGADIHFSSGKVGVGVTVPRESLDVFGNARIDGDLEISGNVVGVDWREAKLGEAFINYGDNFGDAAYYKDATGRVFLQGRVTAKSTGYQLFNLDKAFLPIHDCLFPAVSSAGFASISINRDGQVQVVGELVENENISLEGISFLPLATKKKMESLEFTQP